MRFNLKYFGSMLLSFCLPSFAIAGGTDNSIGYFHPQYGQQSKYTPRSQVENLQDAASRSGRLIGAAVGFARLFGDDTYSGILEAQYNYLTPGNESKWGPLQPAPGEWKFDSLDLMVDYSLGQGLRFKGHTLVWHSQAPAFINESLSPAQLQDLMDQHINTAVSRYKGRFYAWDVVNEAMNEDGTYRESVFYKLLGEDYIAQAFKVARAADRSVKLYYNDYNIAGINAKSNGVYDMMKGLKNEGVPVDGIGLQMHLVASSAPSYEELVDNLQRFADLGLRVNISELDVRVADLPWDRATKLAIQRQVYHRVVSACLAVRRCEALTVWGIADSDSWIDSTFGADDPLPWDDFYTKKPAYFGLIDGFMGMRPDAMGAMPNLIANSSVEAGLDGWSSTAGTLSRTHLRKTKGWLTHGLVHGERIDRASKGDKGPRGESALRLSNRLSESSAVVYDITDVVGGGESYNASVSARIHTGANAWWLPPWRRQELRLSAQLRCANASDEVRFIDAARIQPRQWASLTGELSLPECELEAAYLLVDGPSAGIDLMVDNLSLRPQVLTPNPNNYGPNIVANSSFERDSAGWFGFGDAVVSVTTETAFSGQASALASARIQAWQGPATSILAGAEPGSRYDMMAYVNVPDGANVNATVKAVCADTERYISVASRWSRGWTLLRGEFAVPDCELSELTLYFEGPEANVDFYLDDVYVRKDEIASIPNLVHQTSFEEGLAAWSTWAGILRLSNEFASTGNFSAVVSNRTDTWQGPVLNLLQFSPPAFATYTISAQGRVSGSAAEYFSMTVKTTCVDGTEAYTSLASATVSDTQWTPLSGEFTAECALSELVLYFEGPAAEADIYVDDVSVIAVPNDAGGELITIPLDSGWRVNPSVSWSQSSDEVLYSPIAHNNQLVYDIAGLPSLLGATLSIDLSVDQAFLDSGTSLQPIVQLNTSPWSGHWDCWIDGAMLATEVQTFDCVVTTDVAGAGYQLGVQAQNSNGPVTGVVTIHGMRLRPGQ